MVRVDADSDPATTIDSSSATLSLPAPATLLFAGLYFGAATTAGTGGQAAPSPAQRNTVKFKVPGAASYATLTAGTLDTGSSDTAGRYQGFVNVTDLVAAAGSGVYWVGDVQAGTGLDRYAGWALVVVYRDPSQPARNLTVFDGYASVTSGIPPVSIPLSDFRTPPSGPVRTTVGVVAYEGDLGTSGDSLALNQTTLSDAANPANNFFNSSITSGGVPFTVKNPNFVNQLGFDSNMVAANGVLPNGATSATITLKTSSDQYFPGVVTFATDLFAPSVQMTKAVANLTHPGGPNERGDRLRYTVAVTNSGQDGARDLVARDPIPVGATYVPGTLRLVSGPSAPASPTDAVGDDLAEFDAAGQEIVFRLGQGASATAGGLLAASGLPGNSTSFSFDVTINSGLAVGSQIVNQARAEFVAQSLDTPLTAQSGQVVTSVDAPDLTIAKSHAPQFLAGAATTFTLSVSNIGTLTTDGSLVTVSDPFPSGAAGFDSISISSAPGWSCSTVATTLTCTRSDPLAAGAAYPAIQVGALVHNPEPGTIANTATVSGGGDSVAGNNTATDVGPTTSEADLDLTKTVDQSVVPSGGQVTFQLTVLNRGPSTATTVTIDDPLGGSYTTITVDTSQGTCTTTVHCDLGDLAANTTATVTINATVAASDTTLANTATTASATTDPSPGNNSATAGFVVPASANLTLTKTLTANPAAANPTAGLADGAVYTLTVRNLGPDTATTVDVTDPLPALFTPSAVTAPGFSCNLPPAGGTLVCTSASLTVADGAQTITITGTLAAATAGTVVENGAWIDASERDPDPDSASAADATLVIPSADLALTKFASSPSAQPGDQVTFTLTLTNNGPSPAQNITITDPLPSGLQFVSASAGCSFAASTVTCTLATLASGATATLTITTSPTGAAAGQTLTNTATVTSTTPDPASTDNVASETLEVSPAAPTPTAPAATPESDLAAAITTSPTSVAVGDDANLTAVVSNRGPSDATAVTLTTRIPAGFEIVSAPSGCTTLAGSVTCSVASLPVGGSMSFVIVVRPTSAAAGQTVTSSVTVVGSQPDPDPANNSATVTLTVAALVDLELKESHSPLAADSTGTITTAITNHGPDTATDVVFTTTLPAGITELSAQSSEGSCSHSGRHVTCELGPLAAGSSDRIVLEVHIAEDLRDHSIEIQATVTAAQKEANPAHTSATLKAHIREGAAIASTVIARETSVKGGGTVHYTLAVRSTGRLPALQVRVCARLPQDQVYASTPGAVFRNGEACWIVAALPVGHTRRIAFTATAARTPSTRLSTTREQATAANAQADNATVKVKIVGEPARGGGATG